MNKACSLLTVFLMWTLVSCKGFLGEPTDLSFIDVPETSDNVDGYVPILPVIAGFADPVDIHAGYDNLIYVVDHGAEEIAAYDQAGRRMAAFKLPGVKAVAQDRRLHLLALAETDTTIGDVSYRLNSIYRLRLYNDGIYDLSRARVINRIIHPFYYKSSVGSPDADVSFNDVAVLANNSYYVSRSGPRNLATQFGGPDNNVLLFSADDMYLGPVAISTSQGAVRDFFRLPFALTTLAQPPIPPATTVSGAQDFFVSLLDSNLTLQVLAMRAFQSDQGTEYEVRTDLVVGDTARADGFLYQPNRFKRPMGLTAQFGKSGTNYLFVIDERLDSVYKFSSVGLEGVSPLPSAQTTKWSRVSFGGHGAGPTQFDGPTAVANLDNTLYVCDRGNRRIVRFRLARDME